ncbi:MAG: DUF6798 domain-containing protein [Thermoguttaceae bacterium]
MQPSDPLKIRPAVGLVLAEIVLIFAAFFLQGAWPVPDSNEPHYLSKAIHYWNADWLRGDFFMETPGVHRVFDVGFGWLSLWLAPTALAWTGRALTWLLLAWAWRRLSWAIVPRPGCAVLTALLFGWLTENCHMAGEWVIGGVEAKGFAYVLVFLGLEAIVRNRWNRGLLCLGGASAIHVVVGGWSAVAAAVGWLRLGLRPRETTTDAAPSLRLLWPGILGGFVLALPGLLPGLSLDWGVDRETLFKAHEIYVFQRLPHHLTVTGMQPWFVVRMAMLCGFWLLLGRWERRCTVSASDAGHLARFRAFVAGAVMLSLVGAAISGLAVVQRGLAAELLRFYWFRLTDIVVPMAVALESVWLLVGVGRASVLVGAADRTSERAKSWRSGRWPKRLGWALAIAVAGSQVGIHASERVRPGFARSEKMAKPADWIAACEWVARSGEIPRDALFLVPRASQTFSWHSRHGNVVTWKDVPQSAEGLVAWWRRIEDIHGTGQRPPAPAWHGSLSELSEGRLRELGRKYGATFLITERTEALLKLDLIYENSTYVIYRLQP